MSGRDESVRLADRLESALLTDLQHQNGGRCLNCTPDGCKQNDWAQAELAAHSEMQRRSATPQLTTEHERGDPR
ncbi:hypothetical protein ABZ780_29045 [Micromonospora sp. NPDC047467]|uniref:hypothetical protein n=1 Tax=Micromonospora sp. NPDC047467 TaxID=3154814 RepID=UPI0034055904